MCSEERLWREVGKMGSSGNRDCQWASRSVLKMSTRMRRLKRVFSIVIENNLNELELLSTVEK